MDHPVRGQHGGCQLYTWFPVGTSQTTRIIGLCGGSGSGKTTLAVELAKLLADAQVLCFDSYYRDLGHLTLTERAQVNFDSPDSLDAPLLVRHLQALAQGKSVAVPVYDFTTHTRSEDVLMVDAHRYIILEGILLFAFPEIRRLLDVRVFLDSPTALRLSRRLERDLNERGRTEQSVVQQWNTTVEPMHRLHVEPNASHAHVVVQHGPPVSIVARNLYRQIKELDHQRQASALSRQLELKHEDR